MILFTIGPRPRSNGPKTEPRSDDGPWVTSCALACGRGACARARTGERRRHSQGSVITCKFRSTIAQQARWFGPVEGSVLYGLDKLGAFNIQWPLWSSYQPPFVSSIQWGHTYSSWTHICQWEGGDTYTSHSPSIPAIRGFLYGQKKFVSVHRTGSDRD